MIWVFFAALGGIVILFGVKYYELRADTLLVFSRLRRRIDTTLQSITDWSYRQSQELFLVLGRHTQYWLKVARRRLAAGLRWLAAHIDLR